MKRNETIDKLALARRIRAAGRPIFIREDDVDPEPLPIKALCVRQTGPVMGTSVFEYSGGTGVMIDLCITVNISGFAIGYFDLDLPWPMKHFRWFEDPKDTYSPCYQFWGTGLEFRRTRVLNHRADGRLLSRGQTVEGLLLGSCMAFIPVKFRQGEIVTATLFIADQYEREYRTPVNLIVDRSQSVKPHIRKEHNVFDCPDKIKR